MPMRRLLTLSQNLKPSFPNLNPHVSAFFQHAEALNDKKKKKNKKPKPSSPWRLTQLRNKTTKNATK